MIFDLVNGMEIVACLKNRELEYENVQDQLGKEYFM